MTDDPGDMPRRTLVMALAGLSGVPALGSVAPNVTPADVAGSPEWIDVRAHGARCDGRTDDAPAIQAAIEAALATPLSPPVLVPGVCHLARAIRIRRPADKTKSVLRIVGAGPGAGFRSAQTGTMFVGDPIVGAAPNTEFIRFESVRFEGTVPTAGPVMSGDFFRITFSFCEFTGIACLVTDRFAQEWRFLGCLARRWRGPFFAAAGGYNVTSSNSKYQFGGACFRLIDPSLAKSGCVGCSFVQDTFEGSVGPFLEFELGKGVNVANLYAEDIESSTIVVGARAKSTGVSVTGCFFGTRPDNVKSPDMAEIVWNAAHGATSIGNVSVGRLHRRDARAIGFVSLGDYEGAAP